jgi:hypothetical protein
MSLFSRKEPTMSPAISETTGTDILRRAVHARIRSPHALTMMAREIDGLATHALEDIAAGKADLKVETLKALTKLLFPDGRVR